MDKGWWIAIVIALTIFVIIGFLVGVSAYEEARSEADRAMMMEMRAREQQEMMEQERRAHEAQIKAITEFQERQLSDLEVQKIQESLREIDR